MLDIFYVTCITYIYQGMQGIEKQTTQKKKDDAKLRNAQLAEKRQKETAATKVQAVRDTAQKAIKQEKAAATVVAQEAAVKVGKGQTMPLQGHEAEEAETKEEGADSKTTSMWLKCQHIIERGGWHKKVKALKLSIDPITLTEGDLHDIGKTVHNVTSEAL